MRYARSKGNEICEKNICLQEKQAISSVPYFFLFYVRELCFISNIFLYRIQNIITFNIPMLFVPHTKKLRNNSWENIFK